MVMRIKTKLIIGVIIFLILTFSSINFHVFKYKQAEVTFLSQIYGNAPSDKPILVMSNDEIENFTSSTGKEFRIYTKTQIEKLVDASPDNQVFYKTLDVTIFLGIVSIKTESHSAFYHSDEIVHIVHGGGTYYGVNLFGYWFIRNFSSF